MQMFRRILGIVLAVMLAAPAAWAQQTHVIDKSALDQAVQQRVSQDQADREAHPQLSSESAGQERRGEGRALRSRRPKRPCSTLQGDELRAGGRSGARR